jgi:hypothetical protein
MMIEPVDSQIATGMAGIGITDEVPASSFEWATPGLPPGVPMGKR